MHIEIDEGISSILIVEDEMIVAMLMEDLMRELGVRDVYLCTDTVGALETINQHKIDLAILDMQVQDGTTVPVADALADRGIPFIFSSGSVVEALPAVHASRPMISKPFHDDDLKLMVLDTWTLMRSAGANGASDQRVATSGATD